MPSIAQESTTAIIKTAKEVLGKKVYPAAYDIELSINVDACFIGGKTMADLKKVRDLLLEASQILVTLAKG